MTLADRTQRRLADEAARRGKELPRECRQRVDDQVDAWLLEIDAILEPKRNLEARFSRQ